MQVLVIGAVVGGVLFLAAGVGLGVWMLKGDEASEAGNVGEIPGLAPGATKTLRLTLKAGHYALICNMAGHYMAGQRIDFTVK